MENKELDERFTQTELSTLKEDLVKVTQENQLKGQRIEELPRSVANMKQHLGMVTEILVANPSIREIELAIQRQRPREQ